MVMSLLHESRSCTVIVTGLPATVLLLGEGAPPAGM